MATSGTVSAYRFNQRKVIEHAMRRAGRVPERISAEDIQVAQDLIYTLTSQWINAGFPLWTKQYLMLGVTQNGTNVTLPTGTNDVFHTYWRILNPWRGVATTSTGAGASQLFGGQPNPDVTIAAPNPGVIAAFGSSQEVDTIGVLLGGNAPVTAALLVQTSQDGVTFTTAQTLPSTTFTPGQWAYFDLQPVLFAPFLQLVLPVSVGSWTLNQLNFGLANGQDIELGALNQDDYYNLPDKAFLSDRPNSVFVDRLLPNIILRIWPAPNQGAFYNGTVTALVRRYIQDPGSMTNDVEVPQRWAEALIWRLAKLLLFELPDAQVDAQSSYFTLMAKQQRMQAIEAEAAKAEMLAWSEERTVAPIRWAPNISVYTR